MKTYTNNSILFKAAHKLTKEIIKPDDDYQITFGICLKYVKNKPLKASYKANKRPLLRALYNNISSAFEVLTVMLIALVVLVSGEALVMPFEVLTVAFVGFVLIISIMVYCVFEDVATDFESYLIKR